MVTGHIALAYLARAYWPRTALLPLVVASIVPDLVDFSLPPGNRCRAACVLYTHAVPAVFVLAAGAAVLAWYIYHRRVTSNLVAALVVAHVAMDLVTGYKPYWPGGPPLGLQLFADPVADFVLEMVLVVFGFVMLRRAGDAPKVATHPLTLLLLLLVQALFNYRASIGELMHFQR